MNKCKCVKASLLSPHLQLFLSAAGTSRNGMMTSGTSGAPATPLSWCKPWVQVSGASGLSKLSAFCLQSRIWQFGVCLQRKLVLPWHKEHSELLHLQQLPSVTFKPQQGQEVQSLCVRVKTMSGNCSQLAWHGSWQVPNSPVLSQAGSAPPV